MRCRAVFTACALVVGLAACRPEAVPHEKAVVNAVDPYIARALNDPLMVDPDLAYRNEANAAITVGYDHALPSFKRSQESARAAREEARLQLLEDGPIEDLPHPSGGNGLADLSDKYSVESVLAAVEAPSRCRSDIKGDFGYAADLPEAARVMPHGMVRVGATVEVADCDLRIVRYVTPVAVEDALQFHHTMATRAGFDVSYFAQPEASLTADRRGVYLRVFARPTSGDLTAVDVIIWSR